MDAYFFYIVDVTLTNARILHNSKRAHTRAASPSLQGAVRREPLTDYEFRIAVVKELAAEFDEIDIVSLRRRERAKGKHKLIMCSALPRDGGSTPGKQIRRNCSWCTYNGRRRQKTSFYCASCHVPLHHPDFARTDDGRACYDKFHSASESTQESVRQIVNRSVNLTPSHTA